MQSDKLINIGKIIGVFGIKGELKIYSESDFIDYRFRIGAHIYLKSKKIAKEAVVTSMRIHKKTILIQIDNLNDINLVSHYIGCDIYAKYEDFQTLNSDEYYLDDLIGLKVVDENDNNLGEVWDLIEVPQGYILEIKTKADKMLIPFVDEYIIHILEDKIIVKVIDLCQ